MRRLHVIVASNRPGSAGLPVADWFIGHAAAREDLEITLVDLAEVALPFLDEPEHPSNRNYVHQHTRDWSAVVSAADAFVLVMPMYNGGFGAVLKNAIDFLFYEWEDKPYGLVTYSAGTSGGTPAAEMIKLVLARVSMVACETSVAIPGIEDRVGADRVFHTEETFDHAAVRMLDELGELLTQAEARAKAQAESETETVG